ncbi:competence pheromone ComX [Siminovitchia sp. FSL H7-0308]|uniref:ComX pheromone n=1 Tax=Siminovitchia thermophila TaxID=1245522 RepID=A0ABS2R591_9BACI|nr:competence pheromone ComX [Siminovitchia thermophila]MBM7714786.1 competence protein ComX [Siminovitchia thermophila]
MIEMVQYLLNNPDILVKVKEGSASLIGVNEEQLTAIKDVFFGESIVPKARFWK